ncbi:MAG: hypothetical protein RL747_372 [Bacteroidota bacterium]|jgi:hypothetical protein
MENSPHILDPLMEKLENYSKSSVELIQLKIVEKIAKCAAAMYVNAILIGIFMLFVCFANVGFSIWLGKAMGELYLGFFCVAGFYGALGFVYSKVGSKYQKVMLKKRMVSLLLN